MEQRLVEKRLGYFAGAILLWGALILIRLVLLQVVHHQDYLRLAHKAQEVKVKIPAARGSIFDRNGRLLAMSTPVDTVFVNPLQIRDLPVASDILSRILSLDRAELRARLQRAVRQRQGYLVVKPKLNSEESDRLRNFHLDWIGLERRSERHYPNDALAAHVLGSVDFAQHGNGGIEQAMEDILCGRDGAERLLTDVKRRGIESYLDQQAQAGAPLALTIDERIQFVTERELAIAVEHAHGKTGSAVAMNPYTGDILAMASYPSFDPGKPLQPGESLANRFNHAVSVPFEPGSVFKVVTLSAALETTRLRPDSIINCGNGAITLFGRTIHEAHRGYGSIPMFMVLAKSSNIGAIQIGMQVGQQNMYEYVRRFGMGQRSGLDLPAESKGMLRKLERWGKTSLASIAMGHEISVTTLQLARACSVIANGGMIVKPRLILRHGTEAVPVETPRRVLRPETAITMRRMMEGVVVIKGATGNAARLEGYSVGGKTGTGQIFDYAAHRFTHSYNSTFMGFAPLTNPAIVVVVTVNGTHLMGGSASAPAFKVITQEALRILNVTKDLPEELVAENTKGAETPAAQEDDATIAQIPSEGPNIMEEQAAEERAAAAQPSIASAPASAEPAGPKVPDFQGKTMRAVVEEASAKGLEVMLDGSGIARMQQPPPGSVLRPGDRIRVQFAR
jgi:cell division protein FtsI (penicillin-binding protein 3)